MTNQSHEPHFVVIRRNPAGRKQESYKHHPSFDDAQAEAVRLAQQEGDRFDVYEYKGTAGRPIPPVDFFPPAQIEA